MLPARRDPEWRPVATARVPAHWIGLLVGSSAGLALCVFFRELGYAAYAGAGALCVFLRNRITACRLARLRDEGTDRQFAVTLRLRREGVYGHDEGLVAFEDGYLVYMGRRCAFSLGAADVSAIAFEGARLGFDFPGPAGEHGVEITAAHRSAFLTEAVRWKAQAARSDTSVLPPAHPDPNLSLALVTAAETLPLVAVALAAVLTAPKGTFGHAIVGIAALFVPLYAFHSYTALRRIASDRARRPPLWDRLRRRQNAAETALPPNR